MEWIRSTLAFLALSILRTARFPTGNSQRNANAFNAWYDVCASHDKSASVKRATIGISGSPFGIGTGDTYTLIRSSGFSSTGACYSP